MSSYLPDRPTIPTLSVVGAQEDVLIFARVGCINPLRTVCSGIVQALWFARAQKERSRVVLSKGRRPGIRVQPTGPATVSAAES